MDKKLEIDLCGANPDIEGSGVDIFASGHGAPIIRIHPSNFTKEQTSELARLIVSARLVKAKHEALTSFLDRTLAAADKHFSQPSSEKTWDQFMTLVKELRDLKQTFT